MSNDSARLRLSIVGIIVISLFSAIFARLWYLQVLDSETLQAEAVRNQKRLVFEPAPRGRVLDRKGRPLVENHVSEAVTVTRIDVKDNDAVLGRLAALLGISVVELERRIQDPRFSPYRPVPVAEGVPEDKIVYLREHQADFPGVQVQAVAERAYPNQALAAHVLGYVGEINDTELAKRETSGYRLGDEIGKSGVEQTYETDLRGRPSRLVLEVDSAGRVVATLSSRPPQPGHDVQLTLDLDVQRLAEESLAQGLEASRRRVDRENRKSFVAPAGSVVVMDPRDGSVLAMASFPTYDPTAFVSGISRDLFRSLQDKANHFPLTNRAIQGQYAPGSTFKLFTALAALQRGAITPKTTLLDEGSFRLRSCRGERCVFRNAGSRAYGRVDLTRALVVSSDVFFYNLGANFWFGGGPNRLAIQETARQFGLGERTGIPLASEQRGRIPDPESRRRLHELRPDAFPEGQWRTGDNVNLSIGQGETVVTPLQLANAYAAFANGGTLFEPKIAARVLDGRGRAVREIGAKTLRQVPLDPNARAPILQGLRGAVFDPTGTAAGAFAGFPLDVLSVAGKTGTAQVSGRQDTALFAAVAPVENPQYVVAVVMEEAGFGGSAAAPVARRILQGLAGSPPGPVQLVGGID
ncbi:MAG TPA: penicillin-binding protein 2 [Acidimicrobiales bacterium]|nr:penicillin-binding protein 2 [Acidimicrobiales bacterium]